MGLSRRAGAGRLATAALAILLAGSAGAQVPVRHTEGVLHGFLLLHDSAGTRIAQGDLLQVARRGEVSTRMVFYFDDGSVLDERVTFTQDSTFRMRRYQLIQRGPAFRTDLEARVDGETGEYRVAARDKGEEEGEAVHTGTLEVPADVSNGLVIIIAKNLLPEERRKVHFIAFTPEPQLIELEFEPQPAATVTVGKRALSTAHWLIKPDIGTIKGMLARVTGQMPPDMDAWIVTHEVPAFVRFRGPLFPGGPAWRIDLTNPELAPPD